MPRTTAQRRNDGKDLRDAMANYDGGRGIGLKALSLLTGGQASHQLIGFLKQPAAVSRHHRKTTSPGTAAAIEDALGVPRGSLFDRIEVPSRNDPQPSFGELQNASGQ